MGLTIPSIELQLIDSNCTYTNAYVSIAHYDINFRNYKPELVNAPVANDNSNEKLQPYITEQPSVIMTGKSMLINYGVWASKDSRLASEPPLSVLTYQYAINEDVPVANVYDFAYSLLQQKYVGSTNI